MSNQFLPEGRLLDTPENQAACATLSMLQRAMEVELIVEGRTILCTPEHDLVVSVGSFTGIVPREETAMGIREGTTREIAILTRVGKAISFTVTAIDVTGNAPKLILSRRRAQELAVQHLMTLPPKTILPATVTHIEHFGAFVDIGCGFVSMVGIENISVSRISHPNRRFSVAQQIYVMITGFDREQNRIFLSHKELLGTWEENAGFFSPGMTVSGFVRGIKEYGTFIELMPNLTGLADFSEKLKEDDRVSVFIKAILPDRMKIKLMVIHQLEADPRLPELQYRQTSGQLEENWSYEPLSFREREQTSSKLTSCF